MVYSFVRWIVVASGTIGTAKVVTGKNKSKEAEEFLDEEEDNE